MILRERPPIKFTLDGFRKYRDRQVPIEYLAAQLNSAMGLLEGDIPEPIREVIIRAEANIDSIRFSVNEAREYDEVGKIWREVDEVIARYAGPEATPPEL